jgi:hypothetical protein
MDDGSDALRRVTVLLVKKMEMEETCRISRTLNTCLNNKCGEWRKRDRALGGRPPRIRPP